MTLRDYTDVQIFMEFKRRRLEDPEFMDNLEYQYQAMEDAHDEEWEGSDEEGQHGRAAF